MGVIITITSLLAACNLAPPYQPPPMNIPPGYKETGAWLRAKPGQAELDRGCWWEMYQDPILNQLEMQVLPANQNLQAALARYDQARAAVQVAHADYFPTIVGAANPGAIHTSDTVANPALHRQDTDYSIGLNVVYEVDLWGQVRNSVRAAGALAQASAADMAALNLSLQAELASDYFSLRGDDALQPILSATIRNYQKALYYVRQRHQEGLASISDVESAENQLETAKTIAEDTRLDRAQREHAIAVLTGQVPALFTIEPAVVKIKPVTIAPALPATLLERRPDIAAAERRVEAANANIGVARAAFFPNVTISGGIGLESETLGNLFKAASLIWAFGPLSSATIINNGSTPLVRQTLFDGGRLSGLDREAWGSYMETVANYRQTVLTAMQEVEDNLVAIRELDQESATQHRAAVTATAALAHAYNLYHGGLTTYLDLVVLQNTALQSQLAEVNVNTRRQVASILLIKALGGSPNPAQ